jgi:hypothetical protein
VCVWGRGGVPSRVSTGIQSFSQTVPPEVPLPPSAASCDGPASSAAAADAVVVRGCGAAASESATVRANSAIWLANSACIPRRCCLRSASSARVSLISCCCLYVRTTRWVTQCGEPVLWQKARHAPSGQGLAGVGASLAQTRLLFLSVRTGAHVPRRTTQCSIASHARHATIQLYSLGGRD